MLGKPDEQQLKALHALKGDPNWEKVRMLLENSLYELRQHTDRQADEVQMRWNQGACQILSDLLDCAENAANKLKSRSK